MSVPGLSSQEKAARANVKLRRAGKAKAKPKGRPKAKSRGRHVGVKRKLSFAACPQGSSSACDQAVDVGDAASSGARDQGVHLEAGVWEGEPGEAVACPQASSGACDQVVGLADANVRDEAVEPASLPRGSSDAGDQSVEFEAANNRDEAVAVVPAAEEPGDLLDAHVREAIVRGPVVNHTPPRLQDLAPPGCFFHMNCSSVQTFSMI